MTQEVSSLTVAREDTKAGKVLASFIQYCNEHPDERFWQALRNWSGYRFVWVGHHVDRSDSLDTYYWRDRNTDVR